LFWCLTKELIVCDTNPVRNWLIAIFVAIGVALFFVVAAAINNGDFFTAYLSPAAMTFAAAFSYIAMMFCSYALKAIEELWQCMRTCWNENAALTNIMKGVQLALGVQTAACAVVAAYSWIPGLAQPALWAIIITLGAQALLIAGAIYQLVQLGQCAGSTSR
jgi:hypothetical protein